MTFIQGISMIGTAFLITIPIWFIYLIAKITIIHLWGKFKK
tara:strand:+ start:1469 stop:1591 length:123 start_codon:yes stop_codon:yes gene_type:complete